MFRVTNLTPPGSECDQPLPAVVLGQSTPRTSKLSPSPRGLRLNSYRGFTDTPLVFSRYLSRMSVMASPPRCSGTR
jgi:hypothetical protein